MSNKDPPVSRSVQWGGGGARGEERGHLQPVLATELPPRAQLLLEYPGQPGGGHHHQVKNLRKFKNDNPSHIQTYIYAACIEDTRFPFLYSTPPSSPLSFPPLFSSLLYLTNPFISSSFHIVPSSHLLSSPSPLLSSFSPPPL